tara:strand:- start:173 stop:922 length:750 start_codon:yes stop_codon:yes gene_type:complete
MNSLNTSNNSKKISLYTNPEERSKFFINGFTILDLKETNKKKLLFKKCRDINNNIHSDKYHWKEIYKSTEDYGPKPFKDDYFIDFLFDQNFDRKIEEITGHELFLGDFAVRRTFPSFKSYMRWHRDTHFYKNKNIVGRIPPIYKIIIYVNNDGESPTDQLLISPKSHLRFKNNKYLDIINAMIRPKLKIKSSNVKCIFINSMVQHSVVQNLRQKGSSIRLFYNFCLRSQLEQFPDNEDLHNEYIKRKNY